MGLGSYSGGTGKGESPADGKSKSSSGGGNYGNSGTGSGGLSGGKGGSVSGEGKGNKGGGSKSGSSGKSSGGGGRESTGGRGRDGFGASSARGSDSGGRESTGGRGRGGFGASSARSGSTRSGGDSPSEGGSRFGGGGLGTASGYSGLGGTDSPSESARSRVGAGLSPDRPDNRSYAGPVGLGLGGTYLGDRPTYRSTENRSMSALANYNAPSFRSTEIASMQAMDTFGKEVVSVIAAGPGWTTVQLQNGTVETRRGVRSTRNNNPGNIEYGNFAKKHGAIGTDSRFAVFSSPEVGKKAMEGLVFGPTYAGKTINEAISKYAPPSENNTPAYAAAAARAAGATVDTPLSSLSQAQRSAMIDGMIEVEGAKPYSATTETEGRYSGFTPTPGNAPTPSSADRFASAYLGKTGTDFADDPASLPVGPVSGSVLGDGIAPTFAGQPTTAAVARPTTPAKTFNDKYLSPQAVEKPPAEVEQAKPSIGRTIAATGIDIGLGMIPGPVGMGTGLVNAGLQLTGRPTIGKAIVDDFMSGKGKNTGSVESKGDFTRRREEERFAAGMARSPEDDGDSEPVADPATRFVDKYLRPTPREKWGDRGGYAQREYSA